MLLKTVEEMTIVARLRAADILRRADGCVVARIRPGIQQTIEDARENLRCAVQACGGPRRPLLVDISRCKPLEPEVRHFYTGKMLVDSFWPSRSLSKPRRSDG